MWEQDKNLVSDEKILQLRIFKEPIQNHYFICVLIYKN